MALQCACRIAGSQQTASAPIDEDEVSWDADSDEESQSPTPQKSTPPTTTLAASKETLKPATEPTVTDDDKLRPPRNSSDEKSVADSDASYDLISGATSRAPGSPQDRKKDVVAEESDEEDWE